jgi:hypothetical protein
MTKTEIDVLENGVLMRYDVPASVPSVGSFTIIPPGCEIQVIASKHPCEYCGTMHREDRCISCGAPRRLTP